MFKYIFNIVSIVFLVYSLLPNKELEEVKHEVEILKEVQNSALVLSMDANNKWVLSEMIKDSKQINNNLDSLINKELVKDSLLKGDDLEYKICILQFNK